MSKKDYELIAHVIDSELETARAMFEDHGAQALEALAREMADVLASDNPRFSEAKFLEACGVSARERYGKTR